MKKSVIIFLITAGLSFSLSAQSSDVDYVEGWVDIKESSGEIFELFIGDVVSKGDTIITGDDGLVELIPASGSRIIIQPGTIFSVQERQVGGVSRSVLSCTLGQVSYKFDRLTGAEPDIATPSAICGLRGTEFTVLAGADGSSLIIVESGAVEVESRGESVRLEPDEGVEVRPGEAPGEKFPVLRGEMDFGDWNKQKTDGMMANPLEALSGMSLQLAELIAQMEDWAKLYEERWALLQDYRGQLAELDAAGKGDELRTLYAEKVDPLEVETTTMVVNYRYYALSALSFRRHILSGLYIRMKTQFIGYLGDPLYDEFIRGYNNLLNEYEARVVPLLVEADI